jgi:hypothetical protein
MVGLPPAAASELTGVGPRRQSKEPFITARLRGRKAMYGGPHHDVDG